MGKSSTAVNHWMRDRGRFADLFNGVVFDGEQVVCPEDLEEARGESDILVPDQDKNERQVQRYRDIVMQWKKGPYLALLACESQSGVHYAMPVRNMLYYGEKEWDGSRDLYGMFPGGQEEQMCKMLKNYVPDYRINLVDVGKIHDPEKFTSDLQLIFGMLKYRGDMREEKDRKEGTVNMCKALEDLYQSGVDSGMEMGIQALVETCRELGHTREVTEKKVGEKFTVSREKVRECMEKYWA